MKRVIRDPYAVLGVARRADLAAVKLAYRRQVKACHPDVAPGDAAAAARFFELQHAYDELCARLAPAAEPSPAEARARVRVKAPRRGADRAARLDVTVEDIARGAEHRVELAAGVAVIAKIPPGAEPGATLRFTGLGMPGRDGGPPGDGLVTLRVRPHARYRLCGADVHVSIEVSPRRLAAGGYLRAPTPCGDVQVKIPKGLRTGAVLRIRGRGLPARGKRPAGDVYVTVAAVNQRAASASAA